MRPVPALAVLAFAAPALVALGLAASPAWAGHGPPPALPEPFDPGDIPAWPPGWDLQAPGVVRVARDGDAVLLANPLIHAFGGHTETWAPCDAYSRWNGLDGRWYQRPRAADGTPFAAYAIDPGQPGLGAGAVFYQSAGGACVYRGWQGLLLPRATLTGLFPPEADMVYVAPSLPATSGVAAPELPGPAAVHATLRLAFCLRADCSAGPGEAAGYAPYAHPAPALLGLPPAPPVS